MLDALYRDIFIYRYIYIYICIIMIFCVYILQNFNYDLILRTRFNPLFLLIAVDAIATLGGCDDDDDC